MSIERPLILGDGDAEDAPDAARHDDIEVSTEALDRVGDQRRDRRRGGAVTLPCVLAVAVCGVERRSGEPLAARAPFLREEIGAQAIDEAAKDLRAPGAPGDVTDVVGQHRELRMSAGTVA